MFGIFFLGGLLGFFFGFGEFHDGRLWVLGVGKEKNKLNGMDCPEDVVTSDVIFTPLFFRRSTLTLYPVRGFWNRT